MELTLNVRGRGDLPVSEVDAETLGWYATECRSQRLAKIARDEIERREKLGPNKTPATKSQQRQAPKSEPPKAAPAVIFVGAFADPLKITEALHAASTTHHIVSPATVIGSLPPGCEVFTSPVSIDPYGPEVYNLTGDRNNPRDSDKVGLDRLALARIGAAAGVSWERSHRVDDRSHPHYCAWEAILLYKQFDGQLCRVPGNVEIDVRDGGAAYAKIRKSAEGWSKPNDGGAAQILELRTFLSRHCESKAMNKAIGNMGIRRSYWRGDLKKPFLAVRLAFTGKTDDPELKVLFATMIAQQHLGANSALYGGMPALPPAPPAPRLLQSPPPVGGLHDMDEEEESDPGTFSRDGYADDRQRAF